MIQWYPGHMAKAKREMKENIKLVDLVYFVLDARLPQSSFNEDILEIVANKPILYLYNKSTLADLKKLNKEMTREPFLIIDALTKRNINKIFTLSKEILKDLLDKKKRDGYNNYQIKVMVIGIPNVGKSTLINSLVGRRKASTNPKPGHTRKLDWIKLKEDIMLLDTPGVLWPKLAEKASYSLALSGAIKEEIIKKENLAEYGFNFLAINYPSYFSYYDIMENTAEAFFQTLQEKRGLQLREDAYQIFLNDLKTGKLGEVIFDDFN